MKLSDDQAARRRIQESLDESLLVEAAAGTGKTTQLVIRLVAALKNGAEVDKVVAVTFTRKAAGELKLRLRQQLETARSEADSVGRANLEKAIARLEEARIGTIHGFCAELLRERPVEAGVDPAFEELSEEEAPRLYNRAFRSWVQQKLNDMPEALNRALTRLATWSSSDAVTPLDRIRDAGWRLAEWRDFPALWRQEPFAREAEIDRLVEAVSLLAEVSSKCESHRDYLRVALRPARFFRSAVEKAERVSEQRDYDELEARLVELLRQLKGDPRKGTGFFAEGVGRRQVLEARETLLEQLESFRQRAGADLAARLQGELRELNGRYEELKQKAGRLDFVDLLIRARNLIRENGTVRRHLQDRFTHLFVDEFQDTDPLQAEILLLLVADDPAESDWRKVRVKPGKLFVVGDPKQSIYRFRRADVLLYQQVSRVLIGAGVQLLHLGRNFRSLQPILEAVNAAFEGRMDGDPESGQPNYVPLLEHWPTSPEHPSLIALPAPEPYGWYRVTQTAVEECQPRAVAAFLDWLLNESGWRVRDPEDPERHTDVKAGHVCILFRRFTSWGRDVTRPYIRELDARRIPHVLVGSRTFHRREEVETILAALTAVEWPDDEMSVFATLKGSLFCVSDALLLRFRKRVGTLHPFRSFPEELGEDYEPVVQALGFLSDLHRRRNSRPVVETLNQVLEFTRAHAGFALRPAGDQVLANVQRICDLARSFEMAGGISFRGFVERLKEETEKTRSTEAPVLEEGAEGVRIMTLHSAKGLEAPVVVLADITCGLASKEPDKYVDMDRGLCAIQILGCSPWELTDHGDLEHRRDEAEGVRIAYVAATRARDILVVPTVGDGEIEGWVAPLSRALYPPDEKIRESEKAPHCPDFGESTILSQPTRTQGPPPLSIRPGLHRPRAGQHRVVWWDPACLRLKVDADFGLRYEEILAPDESGKACHQGMAAYRSWREEKEKVCRQGSEPKFNLFTASQALDAPPKVAAVSTAGAEGPRQPGEIRVEILERPADRPSGRRFGTLVHTLLRDVDLEAGEDIVRALAGFHGRVMEAPSSEVEAAARAVSATLIHPLVQKARQARRLHRELPLILNLKDGRTLEGTIDLAFLDNGAWTIVDFKTDADLSSRRAHYERQVMWYVFAVEQITGLPAQGFLLGI